MLSSLPHLTNRIPVTFDPAAMVHGGVGIALDAWLAVRCLDALVDASLRAGIPSFRAARRGR
jgi:hypothetical protein